MRSQYMLGLITITAIIEVTLAASHDEESLLLSLIKKYSAKIDKRQKTDFNKCPEQDTPFPCKVEQCISLKLICNGNADCPDGYDEDPEVCIAYQRIPVEDYKKFIRQQANWMVPTFFLNVVRKEKDLDKIAHALSVSLNIDDFRQRLKMSISSKKKFEDALYAVRRGDMEELEKLGMKSDSYKQVKAVFNNLLDSHFLY